MKFKLRTAGWIYNAKELLPLQELGFIFEPTTSQMTKYSITNSGEPTKEFNTIEELMQFIDTYGQIILAEDTITIYDDYRE
jgi:hypothetical protein